MILKNYINISIKNIVRNKKNTLKIFSITLFSFILFILTTSLSGSLNDFIKNYILNTIEHRTIMIDYSSVQNINIENKINNLFAELKPYIKATNCFIARKRLLYAYALLFEKDLPKAEKLSSEFKKAIKTYPVKGEISAEIEMMDYILDIYKNKVSS